MTRRSRIIRGTMVFVAVLALAGAVVFIYSWWSRDDIVLAHTGQSFFAFIYIAEKKGYFADEGLKVSYKKFSLGKDALTDALAGGSDIATVFETPVVRRAYEGADVGIITAVHSSSENTAIIVRKGRGIISPADLWGRKVGVPKGTNAEFFLHSYLLSEGINRSDVRIIDIPAEKIEQAFINGDVDAIAIWNIPEHMANENIRKIATVFYSDIYTEMSLLAGRRDYIASHPRIMKKLITALVRAERYFNENREDAIRLTVEALPDMNPEKVKAVLDTVDIRLQLNNVLLTILQQEAEWYRNTGTYKGPIPNFRHMVVADYLYDLKPESVTMF